MPEKLTMHHLTKLLSLFFIITIFSCKSSKDIAYFQGDESITSTIPIQYDLKIAPDDILSITVSALNLESVTPFNLPIAAQSSIDGRATGQPMLQTYLVNSDGTINYPILGRIEVAGRTRRELVDLLTEKISVYVKEPIITVRIMNFKVTVLGDVQRPGSFVIQNERISLPEALGLAGDMTIQGKRDNVKVIREEDGFRKEFVIDLTKKDVFASPAYFLKQNDIVYVEPNKAKVRSASVSTATTFWLSLTSTLITLIAVITR
ncbi:MAG: polysaccharide biosynthesis/export family protein [Flavobacteriaceae bacterium]|nr:polysaccharide biosynthesis/export family protein [Flavobacteriaceae bacterium]